MVNKDTILKMALESATQAVIAKASKSSSTVTAETLQEYTEAIYRKLLELNAEMN